MNRSKRFRGRKASSIQVGYVINAGIMTVFISLMLIILGGQVDDIDKESELETVANEVEAKLIEADTIANDTGTMVGYFEPPASGVRYEAEVSSNGKLTVKADDGSLVERDLDEAVVLDDGVCTDGGIEFTQRTENLILDNDASCGGGIEVRKQTGVSRDRS
jgi:hypothetical protein